LTTYFTGACDSFRISASTAAEADGVPFESNTSTPSFDVIGFRQAEKAELTDKPIDLAFKIDVDEFRGVRRLSLKVQSLRSTPQ